MSVLSAAVASKMDQWSREALSFNAMHGAKGGTFETALWANGIWMTGPTGCRSNQCIPAERFAQLLADGWKFSN